MSQNELITILYPADSKRTTHKGFVKKDNGSLSEVIGVFFTKETKKVLTSMVSVVLPTNVYLTN